MRQYTTPEQTAKLIELGFPRPKFEIEAQITDIHGRPQRPATIIGDYSIGELIEMLPHNEDTPHQLSCDDMEWVVQWDSGFICQTVAVELIDALFDMVVKLKEEGVI
jgi:hypothetical protein